MDGEKLLMSMRKVDIEKRLPPLRCEVFVLPPRCFSSESGMKIPQWRRVGASKRVVRLILRLGRKLEAWNSKVTTSERSWAACSARSPRVTKVVRLETGRRLREEFRSQGRLEVMCLIFVVREGGLDESLLVEGGRKGWIERRGLLLEGEWVR